MKEKELYAWIRLILIEAGYEEYTQFGKRMYAHWEAKYFIYEKRIDEWINNHLKNNI